MPKFELHFDITNRTVIEAESAEAAQKILEGQFAKSEVEITGSVDLWDDWGKPNVQMATEVQ